MATTLEKFLEKLKYYGERRGIDTSIPEDLSPEKVLGEFCLTYKPHASYAIGVSKQIQNRTIHQEPNEEIRFLERIGALKINPKGEIYEIRDAFMGIDILTEEFLRFLPEEVKTAAESYAKKKA